MGNTNTQTVSIIQSRITAMVAGFQKDFTAKQSLPVNGTTTLQPAILSQLAAQLALITDVEGARDTLASKVAAKKAGMPAVLAYLSQLEQALKTAFGAGNPQLLDFGIKPPKAKKQLTTEEKALSVAAAKGTKLARGIIGKAQRSRITTQGKPGLALIDAQGNVVPGILTGPTPPGSGTPAAVNAGTVVGSAAPSSPPTPPSGTPPGGSTPPATGSAQ
jgi:hypothetical protein